MLVNRRDSSSEYVDRRSVMGHTWPGPTPTSNAARSANSQRHAEGILPATRTR